MNTMDFIKSCSKIMDIYYKNITFLFLIRFILVIKRAYVCKLLKNKGVFENWYSKKYNPVENF